MNPETYQSIVDTVKALAWPVALIVIVDSVKGSFRKEEVALSRSWFFIVILLAALLQATRVITIEWTTICLLAIAGLPVLVPLFRTNIEKVSIGKEGIAIEMRKEDVKALELKFHPIESEAVHPPAPALAAAITDKLGELSAEAKAVIRSLAHFQATTSGMDSPKRWGFAISHGAPDFLQFMKGAMDLAGLGYATIGERNAVFLTDKGIEFCKNNAAEIEKLQLVYQSFVRW